MKNYLLLFLLCGFSFSLHAEEDFETKRSQCLAIFNDLKKAKGLLEGRAPFLHFLPHLDTLGLNPDPKRKLKMAIAFPDGRIYIEEKTYNICKIMMGDDWKNGLAFILAHEIAHYTKSHNWRHEYLHDVHNAKLEIPPDDSISSENIKSLELSFLEAFATKQIRENEAAADLEAGFMSYLAGYQSNIAGPKFLDLAYQSFELRKSGGNYISLPERKKLIEKTGKKLDSMKFVFEVGNYTSIMGEYEIAQACYEYIAKDYESKEILNNIGILGLSQVIDMIPVELLKYRLPVSIDMDLINTRLEEIFEQGSCDNCMIPDGVKSPEEAFRDKRNLLNKSIAYFDRVVHMDNKYYIGALNKSIAHYLHYIIKEYHPHVYSNTTDKRNHLIFALGAVLEAEEMMELCNLSPSERQSALIDIYNQFLIIYHLLGEDEEINKYVDLIENLTSKNSADRLNVNYVKSGISKLVEQLIKSYDKVMAGEDAQLEIQEDSIVFCSEFDNLSQEHLNTLFTGILRNEHSFNMDWNFKLDNYIDRDSVFNIYHVVLNPHNNEKREVYIYLTQSANDEFSCVNIGMNENDLENKLGMPHKEYFANQGNWKYFEKRTTNDFNEATNYGTIGILDRKGILKEVILTRSDYYMNN